MQRRKVLLPCVTSLFVLTFSGLAFSHHSPTSGPVQQMGYDVTTDIILGLPNGAPPLSSFQRNFFTADLPADLSAYPPDPCDGVAQVWNALLADKSVNFWERRQVVGILMQVMAANQCSAQVVRDEAFSPPVVVSFQPIAAP